jgi:hypothetical protein
MSNYTSEIIKFYKRDLLVLKNEITAFENESDLWKVSGTVNNSPGNLCLHLTGNLNHFIGATLGNTGYVRNRDAEFANKNISKADLIISIDETSVIIENSLSKISDEDLKKPFPLEKHGEIVTTHHMLLHLLIHLGYHLGQINYFRRMI